MNGSGCVVCSVNSFAQIQELTKSGMNREVSQLFNL